MGSSELPEVHSKNSGWEIRTKGTAGGFTHLLSQNARSPLSDVELVWDWSVGRFPNPVGASPSDKEADDYALRVGILIRGDGEVKLPDSLKEAVLNLGGKVSYVVFYSATNKKDWAGKCLPNPYSERVINCFRLARKTFSQVRAFPLTDLESVIPLKSEASTRLESIGLWVFADSDNSKSESRAHLQHLKIGARELTVSLAVRPSHPENP